MLWLIIRHIWRHWRHCRSLSFVTLGCGDHWRPDKATDEARKVMMWRKDSFVFHHWGASAKAAEERGEINVDQERVLGGAVLERLKRKMGGHIT